MASLKGSKMGEVSESLEEFDSSGHGVIERGDLVSVLLELDGETWDKAKANALFTAFDKNGDDHISRSEFVSWLHQDSVEAPTEQAFREAYEASDDVLALGEELEKAIQDLLKIDISELHSLPHPPVGVAKVGLAVMHLLAGISIAVEVDQRGRVQDKSWPAVMKMFSDRYFLDTCRGLKKSAELGKVPPHNISAARKVVKKHKTDFEKIPSESVAATGLACYVQKMIAYYDAIAPALHAAAASAEDPDHTKHHPKVHHRRNKAKSKAAQAAQRAIEAVDGLTTIDVQELKMLVHPPSDVMEVCIAVMYLLAEIDPDVDVDAHGKLRTPTWKGCQKMMAHPNKFLSSLYHVKEMVDSGAMNAANIEAARKLLKPENVDPEVAKHNTLAVVHLVDFVVHLILHYDEMKAAL